jgi:triosephosphate isomerase (TIM)
VTLIIAGNWKMHHGPGETRAFFEAFHPPVGPPEVRTLIFPPTLSLAAALDARDESSTVEVGVQNIHPEPSGAFTGEISAEMAAEAGATLTLVGHSERRHVFGETNEDSRGKVEAAYRAGLTPVLCLGETLDQRKGGRLEEVILGQLDAVVGADGLRERIGGGAPFMVAYEPVWAIGTGETATPEDASSAHGILRNRLRELVGDRVSDRTPILYGGSVKPANAASLLGAAEVDGVLVGGASLDPTSFAAIAAAAAG